jgi:hypothetical protein
MLKTEECYKCLCYSYGYLVLVITKCSCDCEGSNKSIHLIRNPLFINDVTLTRHVLKLFIYYSSSNKRGKCLCLLRNEIIHCRLLRWLVIDVKPAL